MKIFIAVCAVPLSIARPFLKKFSTAWYAPTFKKYGSGKKSVKYRIYLPLGAANIKQAKVVTPPPEVQSAVASKGYEIVDYLSGTAAKGDRKIKIGKLLEDKEVLNKFANDPQRTLARQSDLLVVISRHPYDIIGASFDRGWTSCMDVGYGDNRNYLAADIKRGTLVAYLIKTDDKNINAPISRIFIKRYVRDGRKDSAAVPGRVYGAASAQFKKVVQEFCDEQNKDVPPGLYNCPGELYPDGIPTAMIRPEEIGEHGLAEIIESGVYSAARHLSVAQILQLLKLPKVNVRGVIQQLVGRYSTKKMPIALAQYLADTSPKILSLYIDNIRVPVAAFVKLLPYCGLEDLRYANLNNEEVDKLVDYAAAQEDLYVVKCGITLARTAEQLLKLANGRDIRRLQLAMGIKTIIPPQLVTAANSKRVLLRATNKKSLEAAIKVYPDGELEAAIYAVTNNTQAGDNDLYSLLDAFSVKELRGYPRKAITRYLAQREAK